MPESPDTPRGIDERFGEMVARYLDDALSAEETAELNRMLAEDEARRRCFWFACRTARQRHDYGRDASTLPFATATELRGGERDNAHDRHADHVVDHHAAARSQRMRIGARRYAAAAVVLLAACVGVALWWSSDRPANDTTASHDNPAPAETVATMTHVADAEWASDNDTTPDLGEAIDRGRLRLRRGSAEVMMRSTAMVTLLGATDVEMLGPNRCRLTRGVIVANVPESAHGFTVETPTHTVVDLGTRFSVEVDVMGETRVHVVEGRVDVRPHGGSNATEVRLAAGQAVRASGDAIKPEPIAYSPNLVLAARLLSGGRVTSGAGIVSADPPIALIDADAPAGVSVESNTMELDKALLVIVEQAGLTLNQDLPVTQTEPGRYTDHVATNRAIPAGRNVRSYYVHFDPSDAHHDTRGWSRIETTLRFDAPILGVITHDADLTATNRLLGRADYTYPSASTEFLGLEPSRDNQEPDVVILSKDRRTLTLRLHVRAGASDRLRVITAAEPVGN